MGDDLSTLITLLTDFGTADGYVGEVKGVLHSMVPAVRVVDIAHDVMAQDVEGARLALARYWRRFPVGTVHMVVVDPGVGGRRAAIAVQSDGRFLVGPDNGVLSPALFALDAQVVMLPVAPHAAPTFHGRDVFAPAAARLASGVAVHDLGDPWHTPERRRTPEAQRRADGTIAGEIITVDRFGNAITNLFVRGAGVVHVADQQLPVQRTYAEVPSGSPLALVGSNGLLEVAVRDGRAADRFALARGTPVYFVPFSRS